MRVKVIAVDLKHTCLSLYAHPGLDIATNTVAFAT